MDTALELFLSAGYEKTTVQDIVKRVNVAQGTFYYYFPSKEALLEAIFARYAKNMVNHIQSCHLENATVLEKLQLLISHFYKLCYSGEPGLIATVLYKEKQGELINKVWRQLQVIAAPLFKSILEQGNQEGVTQVTHIDETLSFFAGIIAALLEATSPTEFGHESDPTIIKNKLAIAGKLIETLFGAPAGSIHLETPTS
ncbi:MAG: mycofactocin system transcriptional regulator [Sporomusa sp.]|jgi:AcrR family transcriptional regulator|nr:mycofactocin system transcriptional regulator [Sporomusa sp.]